MNPTVLKYLRRVAYLKSYEHFSKMGGRTLANTPIGKVTNFDHAPNFDQKIFDMKKKT